MTDYSEEEVSGDELINAGAILETDEQISHEIKEKVLSWKHNLPVLINIDEEVSLCRWCEGKGGHIEQKGSGTVLETDLWVPCDECDGTGFAQPNIINIKN